MNITMGKFPMTSVRHVRPRFRRSIGLVDRLVDQWAWGTSAKAVRSRAQRPPPGPLRADLGVELGAGQAGRFTPWPSRARPS